MADLFFFSRISKHYLVPWLDSRNNVDTVMSNLSISGFRVV
jgi:hypothetical protein